MASRYKFLIVIASLIQITHGRGAIYIKWYYFRNPSNTDAKGAGCDPAGDWCDTYFTACFKSQNPLVKKCFTTSRASNAKSISFKSIIMDSKYPNPDKYDFSGKLPEIFSYDISVMDYDTGLLGGHDEIDYMQHTSKINAAPNAGNPEKVAHVIVGNYRSDHKMMIETWAQCEKDYYGSTCNIYCRAQDSSAYGHYTCDEETGTKVCRPGYVNPLNNCKQNYCQQLKPCKNNGVCLNEDKGYVCKCPKPYSGKTCETHLNYCAGQTEMCMNGGTCSHSVQSNKAVCICPVGKFEGDTCEADYPNCLKDKPCLSKSTEKCTETYGGYKCHCKPGYKGTNCNENINECLQQKKLCLNNGTCVDLIGTYRCDCLSGFEGPKCENDVDECTRKTAKCIAENTRSCINVYGGYKCFCKDQWDGIYCHEKQQTGKQISTPASQKTSEEGNKINYTALGIGLGVAVLLILFIVILMVVCRRQGRLRMEMFSIWHKNGHPDLQTSTNELTNYSDEGYSSQSNGGFANYGYRNKQAERPFDYRGSGFASNGGVSSQHLPPISTSFTWGPRAPSAAPVLRRMNNRPAVDNEYRTPSGYAIPVQKNEDDDGSFYESVDKDTYEIMSPTLENPSPKGPYSITQLQGNTGFFNRATMPHAQRAPVSGPSRPSGPSGAYSMPAAHTYVAPDQLRPSIPPQPQPQPYRSLTMGPYGLSDSRPTSECIPPVTPQQPQPYRPLTTGAINNSSLTPRPITLTAPNNQVPFKPSPMMVRRPLPAQPDEYYEMPTSGGRLARQMNTSQTEIQRPQSSESRNSQEPQLRKKQDEEEEYNYKFPNFVPRISTV